MSEVRWTSDLISQKLEGLTEARSPSDKGLTDIDWKYREAAAVLSYFSPDEINPVGSIESIDSGPVERLLSVSIQVYDQDNRQRWMLRNTVRRETLRRLSNREAMAAALQANDPRPQDTLQQMLELYIFNKAPNLRQQNLDQLSSTLQLVRWLEGIVDWLPSHSETSRLLEQAHLFNPFFHMVGDRFRGRRSELQELADYVGVLPTGSVTESIGRNIQEFFGRGGTPLFIHGPGGVGKSTLMSKFILDHAQIMDERSALLFAYIDFDRPGLAAQEPLATLIEVLRQVGIQDPYAKSKCEEVRQRWLQALLDGQVLQGPEAPEGTGLTRIRDRQPFLEEFASLINSITQRDTPFLLVLDTFEEVQRHGHEFVVELLEVLDQLRKSISNMRLVLAGRAPVRDFPTQGLELADLDREAAEGYLMAHGISDKTLASTVVSQIGGNPLTLRLAAEVAQTEGIGSRGFSDLRVFRIGFFRRIQENIIQGQLYSRILNHIADPDVRKLAHPGLVLRRVTPDLISEVLAEPCGLQSVAEDQAQELFNKLKTEVSLLTEAEDGSLVHRPDVRQVMVSALLNDKPLQVKQIHELAARYYERQGGVAARAEEIYHRLFLEPDSSKLDERWLEGVEQYLGNAIDEVPTRAKSYLASRIGVAEVDDLKWDDVDLEDWEQRARRQVVNYMSMGMPERALEALSDREERTLGSPLYLLEAQILESLGRFREARRVSSEGISSASQSQDEDVLLSMSMISSRLDERLGYHEHALQTLGPAKEIAQRRGDDLLLLEVEVGRLRNHRAVRQDRRLHSLEDEIKPAIVDLYSRMDENQLLQNPNLVRDLVCVMGVEHSDVLVRGINLLGLGMLQRAQIKSISDAIATWDYAVSNDHGEPPGLLARKADLSITGDLSAAWGEVSPYELGSQLSQLIQDFPLAEQVAEVIIRILRGIDFEGLAKS